VVGVHPTVVMSPAIAERRATVTLALARTSIGEMRALSLAQPRLAE
jgi:hypothetical protein